VTTIKLPTFRVNLVSSFSVPIFLRVFDPVDKGRALLCNIGSFVSADTALRVRRFEV
jgi:hypothetical protein